MSDLDFSLLKNETDRLLQSEKDTVILAIDGRCASGKTTLAGILSETCDCNLFHMDDFFLRPEQRSPERLALPGENVDHERFLDEVLLPLHEGREILYRRFDCKTMTLGAPKLIPPKRLNIVEGVYSLHPDLIAYYDFKLFLDISREEQRSRILKRNSSAMADKFFSLWIPMEEKYFDSLDIRSLADLIIGNEKG